VELPRDRETENLEMGSFEKGKVFRQR